MVMGEETLHTQVAVIGAGPGGYAAAFRAADLGLDVTLISEEERLGGVCLLRGCIPTKALLEASTLTQIVRDASDWGVVYKEPEIDLNALRKWKNAVVDRLVSGVHTLSKQRDVNVIHARAAFASSNRLRLEGSDIRFVEYEHAILATGARPISLRGHEFKPESRIMENKSALDLEEIPERLLVIGAGYIGMELGMAYAGLGSQVTLVELTDTILPGLDRDIVRPLARKAEKIFNAVHLSSKVVSMQEQKTQVKVRLEGNNIEEPEQTFDRVIVAIGRQPNTENLGLENTDIELDEKGFVIVDEQRRTKDHKIFAVGDITGDPLLAHKAMHEGKVAADVIAGKPSAFDVRAIPAIVYTDPEIAICGISENQAREQGIEYEVGRFSWPALGRAITMSAPEGLTKLIFDPKSQTLLGMGIVGRGAENLISEGALAIEMGAVAEDLALTIHPHPTLSESIAEAAEAFLGFPTHILPPRKR